MKICKRLISTIVTLIAALWCFSMFQVYYYPNSIRMEPVDAVIVLGAAAWGNKPSPVFRERINHAITLYEENYCSYIIFTGGKGFPNEPGESVIARDYAVKRGVKAENIFIENKSKNTFENLYYSRIIAQREGFTTFAVVSDPYHLKRASLIADSLGMVTIPAPTPSTRFTGVEKKMAFLLRETYYLIIYRIGTLLHGTFF